MEQLLGTIIPSQGSHDCRSDSYRCLQASVYVIDDGDPVCALVDGVVKTTLPPASINFTCTDSKMTNPSTWLGIAGLMLMGILMSRSFKGSIITGMPQQHPSYLVAVQHEATMSLSQYPRYEVHHHRWGLQTLAPVHLALDPVKGVPKDCI